MMETARVRTVCGLCHTNCGMELEVAGGRIVSVRGVQEHPANRGRLCPKGLAVPEIVHAPDRLTHPLRRTSAGRFERASWDETLDAIAEKLLAIRSQYGAESVFGSNGATTDEVGRDAFKQFLAEFGSPNITPAASLCVFPRVLGLSSVYGRASEPDLPQSELIIYWGANPPASRRLGFTAVYGCFETAAEEARRRGARLVVIDPARTPFAARADQWIPIRPGTDMALALAMLHVVIAEGLVDQDFVGGHTVGFEELSRHVHGLTPEWASSITGIEAGAIRQLARTYAAVKPASIQIGHGFDMRVNVVQAARAVGLLQAVTGKVDAPGGNVFYTSPKLAPYPTVRAPGERMSAGKYPLFPYVPFPAFVEALETGQPFQPRALICNHMNPVLIFADEARTRRALAKLDLLVVCDLFRTATAEMADFILPDASDFERVDFRPYASAAGGLLSLRQKAIDPPGECRSSLWIERELARRLGLKSFVWETDEEWVDYRIRPSGVSIRDLSEVPAKVVTPPVKYQKHRECGFPTSSGKAELYSERFLGCGYDPMPRFHDPAEQGRTSEAYPLLGSSRRPGEYVHTRFRNIPSLRRLMPEPLLWLHPTDAASSRVADGSMAEVTSPQGRVSVKVRVNGEVQAGWALIDFGWGNPGDEGASLNRLTSADYRDPIVGATPNRHFPIRVKPQAA